ncbi:MAG: FAD-binding oxidoreductase [Chloroflexi bacterium]|nr:FAD-binding oxidoreductase [Chloroflexota bacterium]
MQPATPTAPAVVTFAPDLTALRETLTGTMFTPDTDGYENARAVWNLFYNDARPAAVVKVADADDVARAVRFARESGLEIAVRSGGHSMAGFSTGDGVLVIDTRNLRSLHVDPESRLVSAGAGLTASEVTNALVPHDLAIPFGDTGSVGIAGLTLGGGIGYLARKFGLAIDRVRSVELVTAEGEVLTVSADQHSDLFWALRGGGGNFGVVTRFVYEAVPVAETLSGVLVLPLSAAVLSGALALADAAPEETTTIFELMAAPPAPYIPEDKVGTPILTILVVHAGDPTQGQTVMDGFRALAEPIADLLEPMPYGGIYQYSTEAEAPMPAITRTLFSDRLPDVATAEHVVTRMTDPVAPLATVSQIRVLGGQMGRVAPDATAFAHRNAKVMITLYTVFVDPERTESDIEWTHTYFTELTPIATGAYVNFIDLEPEARLRDAYPEATYARLVEVKRQWDPENVFRRNQNIRPV